MEIDAANGRPQARPRFTVEKLEGKFSKTVMKKNGKTFEPETILADKGWMVRIPKGRGQIDEVHIETWDEMKRLGFDQTMIPLVDDDGEPIGKFIENKAIIKQKELA